ncbi:hypothetical protein ACFL3D_06815 [Candidatus Omnitrophota bacterium]
MKQMSIFIFALLIVFLCATFVYAKEDTDTQVAIRANQSIQPSVLPGDPKKEYLTMEEEWARLKTYSLPAPKEKSITIAKDIIFTVLKSTAHLRGEWWGPTGLIGVNLLPDNYNGAEYINGAYERIFSTVSPSYRHKLENSFNHVPILHLYLEGDEKLESWLLHREAFIELAADKIYYTFTDTSETSHKIKEPILRKIDTEIEEEPIIRGHAYRVDFKREVAAAYNLYVKLQKSGFLDTTLGDIIGISEALLIGDSEGMVLPQEKTVYDRIATAVKGDVKNGVPVFLSLTHRTGAEGLKTYDIIALPDDFTNHVGLLSLIEEDLDYIEQLSRMSKKKAA